MQHQFNCVKKNGFFYIKFFLKRKKIDSNLIQFAFPPSAPFKFEFDIYSMSHTQKKPFLSIILTEERRKTRLNKKRSLSVDFNDWCVVFDFQGCFHTFAFLLFLIRIAPRYAAAFVVSLMGPLLFLHNFNVAFENFHTTRIDFHSRHTGIDIIALVVGFAHDSHILCVIDCIIIIYFQHLIHYNTANINKKCGHYTMFMLFYCI